MLKILKQAHAKLDSIGVSFDESGVTLEQAPALHDTPHLWVVRDWRHDATHTQTAFEDFDAADGWFRALSAREAIDRDQDAVERHSARKGDRAMKNEEKQTETMDYGTAREIARRHPRANLSPGDVLAIHDCYARIGLADPVDVTALAVLMIHARKEREEAAAREEVEAAEAADAEVYGNPQ